MLQFTKMHGAGNDYVYVSTFDQTVANPAELARVISDRHTGVGADGLILVCPPQSPTSAARMEMYNNDGSRGEMCGNGLRCVAKYVVDHGLAKPDTNGELNLDTDAGTLRVRVFRNEVGKVDAVRVNMGRPILEAEKIPTVLADNQHGRVVNLSIQDKIAWPVLPIPENWAETCGLDWRATCVSMGNPHLVLYCQQVAAVPLEAVGPVLERHPLFPRRINVHFVQVHSGQEVTIRTWERGSGITLACGTGASAVCVAGVLTGRTGRTLLAHLPGGDLKLEWPSDDAPVSMTGPATEVFRGEWSG